MEDIWIGWSHPSDETRRALPTLADFIKRSANQEAVAWEACGTLSFL